MALQNYLLQEETLFAFNIWDINSAKAVIDGAAEKKKDIILQTSTNVFNVMPKKQLREFVKSYACEKEINVWLHLDHCKDKDVMKKAVECKWDSVMVDASEKSIDQNIDFVNEMTEYAHNNNVLVEADVGQIKGVEDHIGSKQGAVASKQDIKKFLNYTNIDMIAVAFGNAHGVYKGKPTLHYDLVEYTTQITKIPFVVHGGSGLSDETLKRLMSIANVKKINISTEVKLAYRRGILLADTDGKMEEKEFQAMNIEQYIENEIMKLVKDKLSLYGK